LLVLVDAARAHLAKVPLILKRFRQSVLAAACTGRLTQAWRAEHQELTCCDFGRAAGDGWLEPLFEHREEQELPTTWRYVALGNFGSWGSGATPSKTRADFWKEGTVPWVSPKDMKVSLIGDSQDYITDLAVQSGATIVPPSTILFVVRGMILAHTFPVGLTTRPVTFNQDIRSITPRKEVHPTYLLHALQREGLNILFAVKEATHGTLRLESSTLRRWPIPLPPVKEQAEIVRRVALFMALADTIERRVAAASARADALTQSILAKAFRGELVATEAELARAEGRDYEPAQALLAARL
jgi:type I restriction enzyme S subunit